MTIFCNVFALDQFGTDMALCMWNLSYIFKPNLLSLNLYCAHTFDQNYCLNQLHCFNILEMFKKNYCWTAHVHHEEGYSSTQPPTSVI